jgi:hypothetical protein
MKPNNINWKQNLRRIPDWILMKLKDFKNKEIIIACIKKISKSDIESGMYSHLSISIKDNKLVFPSGIVPRETIGKYSDWNINGHEIVRFDLPKVNKTFFWDAPDWGDWSNGSHEVSMDREVYKRDFIPPRLVEITIELLGEEIKEENVFVFRFGIKDVLESSSRHFRDVLLINLNIMQENVGVIDIFPSDASLDDYLKTIYVNWEILPPGEKDETINRIISGVGPISEETKKRLIARVDFFSKLSPIAYIRGTSGFRRYFGAKFHDNLVAFENLDYGNAAYVMFEDWEKLSKMSRIDLLSGDRKGFTRVVHRSGWEKELKQVIKIER